MTKLKTRARIFVLVILAALPALLLTVYSTIERRASTESQARAEPKRLVNARGMPGQGLERGSAVLSTCKGNGPIRDRRISGRSRHGTGWNQFRISRQRRG